VKDVLERLAAIADGIPQHRRVRVAKPKERALDREYHRFEFRKPVYHVDGITIGSYASQKGTAEQWCAEILVHGLGQSPDAALKDLLAELVRMAEGVGSDVP
jgi:hypothetical protein